MTAIDPKRPFARADAIASRLVEYGHVVSASTPVAANLKCVRLSERNMFWMVHGIKYKIAHTAAIAPIKIGKCNGQPKGSNNFMVLPVNVIAPARIDQVPPATHANATSIVKWRPIRASGSRSAR